MSGFFNLLCGFCEPNNARMMQNENSVVMQNLGARQKPEQKKG